MRQVVTKEREGKEEAGKDIARKRNSVYNDPVQRQWRAGPAEDTVVSAEARCGRDR